MPDKKLVYEAVGKAIKAASGKSFVDAQKLIAEAVLALEGTEPAGVFEIAEPELPPPSVVKSNPRITNLTRVGAPPRSVVKQVWTADQIQRLIDDNTPEVLAFIPENTDKEAHLTRIVTVDTNSPPTIQLSYRPNSSDPDVPFPKKMLFTTDESWDWEEMIGKMQRDAASMYRMRVDPIRTTKISTGGKVVFSNKAEV